MLEIDTSGRIIIDYVATGLNLTQSDKRTIIYTPESVITGRKYVEHKMPQARYSAQDKPASGAAGRRQLEEDVRELLLSIN